MNKTSIISIALAAIVLLGSGGVYATGQIAKSNAISESDAINFAYVDAGVAPDDATVTQMEFDYERGKFVYEIEFMAKGVEYDYTIDSASGKILEKSHEVKYAWVEPQDTTDTNQQQNPGGASGTDQGSTGDVNVALSMEEAKAIALNKAGVAEADVIIEKAKLEKDDGVFIYDIEFYVPNVCEYDYEIDANDGSIREEALESLVPPATQGSGSAQGDSGSSGSSGGAADSGNGNSGNSGSSGSGGESVAPAPAPEPAPAPPVVYDDDDDWDDDWDDRYDDDDDDWDDRYDDDDDDWDDRYDDDDDDDDDD